MMLATDLEKRKTANAVGFSVTALPETAASLLAESDYQDFMRTRLLASARVNAKKYAEGTAQLPSKNSL